MTPETRTVVREARVLVRVPLVEPGEDLSDVWSDYEMQRALSIPQRGNYAVSFEFIEWDGEPEEEALR
jgi:hypothetical protein